MTDSLSEPIVVVEFVAQLCDSEQITINANIETSFIWSFVFEVLVLIVRSEDSYQFADVHILRANLSMTKVSGSIDHLKIILSQ